MAMNVGQDEGEDEVIATINTTPLVDVMLVLLIIFLITIPVVVQNVPVNLPKEKNEPSQTKPEDIVISVNKDGEAYWGMTLMADNEVLVERLKKEAVKVPQPEIHIRGDAEANWSSLGRVAFDCQRASILKVSYVLEPTAQSGG